MMTGLPPDLKNGDVDNVPDYRFVRDLVDVERRITCTVKSIRTALIILEALL